MRSKQTKKIIEQKLIIEENWRKRKKKYYFRVKHKTTNGKLDFTKSVIKIEKNRKNNIGNKNF